MLFALRAGCEARPVFLGFGVEGFKILGLGIRGFEVYRFRLWVFGVPGGLGYGSRLFRVDADGSAFRVVGFGSWHAGFHHRHQDNTDGSGCKMVVLSIPASWDRVKSREKLAIHICSGIHV